MLVSGSLCWIMTKKHGTKETGVVMEGNVTFKETKNAIFNIALSYFQVTVHNPENQSYLIAYKDSQLIVSSAK